MASSTSEVDLAGIRDPQTPVAVVLGVVLVALGIAGLAGVLDMDVYRPGVVLGLFGVPLWLSLTAIVAGLLGIALSRFGGGATTFDKVAAGLVLPAVFCLAITDWAIATGGVPFLVLGVVTLLLAVVFAAVGTAVLFWHPLALVFPVVALLALLDWGLSLTALTPNDPVTLPTLGLLLVVELVVLLVAFEGGRRLTGRVP